MVARRKWSEAIWSSLITLGLILACSALIGVNPADLVVMSASYLAGGLALVVVIFVGWHFGVSFLLAPNATKRIFGALLITCALAAAAIIIYALSGAYDPSQCPAGPRYC
jgi:hypothetical protein